jgi:imidazole glycerol-phosphate synthase subunit HisH
VSASRTETAGNGAGAVAATRPRIAVLDYGMGNLRSVEKALERAGAAPVVTRDHAQARAADGIVLPGVGAFPKAMRNLRDLGLDAVLGELVAAGVPTLGICLGMQLLFESSSENEGSRGLGFLQGRVERLPAPGLKVPLIGWSPVRRTKHSSLWEGLPDDCPFYFVHSFAPTGYANEDLLGTAEYGSVFACAVERGAIYGVQFHPEKSSVHGLRLLRNFAAVCAPVGAAS